MPLQIDSFANFKAVTEFHHNHFYREQHHEEFATVTASAGDYFYEGEFDLNDAKDRAEYQSLIDYCVNNGYIAVIGSRPKELVFA